MKLLIIINIQPVVSCRTLSSVRVRFYSKANVNCQWLRFERPMVMRRSSQLKDAVRTLYMKFKQLNPLKRGVVEILIRFYRSAYVKCQRSISASMNRGVLSSKVHRPRSNYGLQEINFIQVSTVCNNHLCLHPK